MSTKSRVITMLSAVSADGNGSGFTVDDYLNCQQLEIANVGAGTCTVAIQGSLDDQGDRVANAAPTINWVGGVGYQQVDAIAAPARAVTAITVGANSRHVYQILDPYRSLRLVVAATAGATSVTARLYACKSY